MRTGETRFLVLVALVLAAAGAVWADPYVQLHPGDVFIRADELNPAGTVVSSTVYKFDPPRDPPWNIPEPGWWSAGNEPRLGDGLSAPYTTFNAQTEGLSVDKFERLITVYSTGLSAETAVSLPAGHALKLVGGTLQTIDLRPSGGWTNAAPGDVWVPTPVSIKAWTQANTVAGAGCGSWFIPSPRTWPGGWPGGYPPYTQHVNNASDRPRAVVGYGYWFLNADVLAATAHIGDGSYRSGGAYWGPGNLDTDYQTSYAPQVCDQMWKREDHKRVFYYIHSSDYSQIATQAGFDPLMFPGGAGGPWQVGDNVVAALWTRTAGRYFSPCGDQCKYGTSDWAEPWQGHSIETRFLFSSAGHTVTTQRMYALFGQGNLAYPVRYVLNPASNTWITDSNIPADKKVVVGSNDFRAIGIAASLNPNEDDYIYMSDLSPDDFAVSTRFWRNGGTYFQVRKSGSDWFVDWTEDYPGYQADFNGSGSLHLMRGVSNDKEGVRAITADGRGNLYFLHTTFDPSDTADFETLVDPANPTANPYYNALYSSVRVTEPTSSTNWPAEKNQFDPYQKEIVVCQYPTFILKEFNYITDGGRQLGVTVDATDTSATPARTRGRLAKGAILWKVYAKADQQMVPPVIKTTVSHPAAVVTSFATSMTLAVTSVTTITSSNETITWPSGSFDQTLWRTVERTTISSDPDSWHQTRYTTITQESIDFVPKGPPGPYSWVSPFLIDSGGTAFKDIDVDMACVNVTEPPVVQQVDSDPDVYLPAAAGAGVIAEDSTITFRAENGPVFSGMYTNPEFGRTNVNCNPNDEDVDGVGGYFSSSLSLSTLRWRWRIYSVSTPVRFGYHNGSVASYDESNDGCMLVTPWQQVATGTNSVLYTQPCTMPGPSVTFADPGKYVAVLDVHCEQWYTDGTLNYLSTPSDIKRRWIDETAAAHTRAAAAGADQVYHRAGATSVLGSVYLPPVGPDGLVFPDGEVLTCVEGFEVRPQAKNPQEYVYEVKVVGPGAVMEDEVFSGALDTPRTNDNVFAEAEIKWYKAFDYRYDTDQGGIGTPDFGGIGTQAGRRMDKYDGVGSVIYPRYRTGTSVDVYDESTWGVLMGEAERQKVREGLSHFGTRATALTSDDWDQIHYAWYVKVPDPGAPSDVNNPSSFVAGASPHGLLLCEGTLKPLWEREEGAGVMPLAADGSQLALAVPPAGFKFLQPLDDPDPVKARHFRVRIPLAAFEDGVFKKYGGVTPTFPAKAFFTCVIRYPRVEWQDPPPPYDNKEYFYLFQAAPDTHPAEYSPSGSGRTDPAMPADFAGVEIRDKTLPSVCVFGVSDTSNPGGSVTSATYPPAEYLAGWGVSGVDRTNATTAEVRCGKPIPFPWAVDVYDNNPFLHWGAPSLGTSLLEEVPTLSRFFWEVGRDIRNHGYEPDLFDDPIDLNAGITGAGWLGTGDAQLGFDVARTEDAGSSLYRYHQKASEPCGFNGGVPFALQNPVSAASWKFSHGVLVRHVLPTTPTTNTGRGVDVTSFNPPAANERASIFVSDIDSWLVKQDVAGALPASSFPARGNGRWARWTVAGYTMVMPWFLREPMIENLYQFGDGRDRYYFDRATPSFGRDSDLASIGRIGLGDTVPPNLKIEITDYATGQTVTMALQPDMEYPIDSSQDWSLFAPDFDRVHVSEDQRPVAVRLGLARPFQTFLRQPVDVTNNTGAYRYDATTRVHILDYACSEDVPYVVKVWAVDNATRSDRLVLTVNSESINPAGTPAFRALALDPVHGIVEGKAFVTGTHRYPRENCQETIRIRVEDEGHNAREVRVNFSTTAHNLDFRVISDRLQKR